MRLVDTKRGGARAIGIKTLARWRGWPARERGLAAAECGKFGWREGELPRWL